MRKEYNKLVRDNMPAIIENAGRSCFIRKLDQHEFLIALRAKIVEEAHEVASANTRQQAIEELTDLQLASIWYAAEIGIEAEELEEAYNEKIKVRGEYYKKLFLEWTEDAGK